MTIHFGLKIWDGIILQGPHVFLLSGIFQIGLGFVLFTAGAKYLQAVELTLLSLTEVIAGPIIVWIVISEIPSTPSLTGGALILAAIILMALMASRTDRRVVAI